MVGEQRLQSPRSQGLDILVRMDGDPLQNVDQISVWTDAVQPASRDQTLDDADVLGTNFTPTE